jgi:hypothetical protein
VGDIVGGYRTIVQEFPLLPGTLPNRVVAVGARYGQLPDALRNTLTYAFGRDGLGDLIDPVTLPLARVNNQRLTLSFKPATAADEAALKSLLPEGQITDVGQLPTSIPAYLVQVVPELRLNGELLKAGGAMRLGDELGFLTQVKHAGRTLPAKGYNVIAGSYLAVAADSGSVSPAQLQAVRDRLAHAKATLESGDAALIGGLTREELLGDLFHAGLLGYYAQLTGLAHVLGLQQHAHHLLAAGIGTYGYEPKVDYFFGFPRAIKAGGAVMNIPIYHVTGQDANDRIKKRNYLLQVGIVSSGLEHAVPEQMFTTNQNHVEGISAVKALQKAIQAGQKVYHITPANLSNTLPNIHHNSLVMQEIQNALNAGKEVITHTDAVSVPGWSGAGYVIFDPQVGDGAFKIGGGQNGGFLLIVGSALLFVMALLTAGSPISFALLFFSLLLAGCGLSALFQDDRYFDVYALIAVSLIGALLEAASVGGMTVFMITAFLELQIIIANYDDLCANLSAGIRRTNSRILLANLLPSRSKNAYFESYKISAKPREIKACGILQSGRFMSEKGVRGFEESHLYESDGGIQASANGRLRLWITYA